MPEGVYERRNHNVSFLAGMQTYSAQPVFVGGNGAGDYCLRFFSISNFGDCKDMLTTSFLYTQENGKTFSTREDADVYIKLYLQNTESGQLLAEALKKAGLEDIVDMPAEKIMDYRNIPEIREKLDKLAESDPSALSMIYMYLNNIQAPLDKIQPVVEFEEEEEKSYWEAIMIPKTMPEWKKELLMEQGYENLQEQTLLRKKNKEFLPLTQLTGSWEWFDHQFGMMRFGLLWGTSLILAGIIAARSLGGSFQNQMTGMLYTQKKGRGTALYKVLSVMAVSGAVYLALSIVFALVCIWVFRLDLYWDVSLAAISTTRFPITIGGYWLFQLGVGLAAVLIMAVIFSTAMMVTRSFFAGSAISVGISLLLLGLIANVPAAQNSILLMGSPIGLYLNVGKFLQERFLFSILPHFEGVMLLIWCGISAVLAAVGFMRFRKSAL